MTPYVRQEPISLPAVHMSTWVIMDALGALASRRLGG